MESSVGVITTNRLVLNGLGVGHADFFLRLVNSPGWLQFIGDRNVKTNEQAVEYIARILDDPAINYWVVSLKNSEHPVGVITFITREYLEHSDLGFAFLPAYSGKGFAYEATVAVLTEVTSGLNQSHIQAITVEENSSSIHLLKKLGFTFEKEIHRLNEALHVYQISVDKYQIDRLVGNFFSLFTNKGEAETDWRRIESLCLPETILIKKNGLNQEVYDLQAFIQPRRKILSDGTLTEFEEGEVSNETTIVGNRAQRSSLYRKSGLLNGISFQQQGHKFFQFVKMEEGWKIGSVMWEDEN